MLGVWDGENWGLVGHCVEMGMLKISTFVLGCGHKRVIRRKKKWRMEKRKREREGRLKKCVFSFLGLGGVRELVNTSKCAFRVHIFWYLPFISLVTENAGKVIAAIPSTGGK